MKATRKHLVGRTITDVSFRPFDAHPGVDRRQAHDPILTLDNGASVRFVTEETDGGEYGTEIVYVPNRKQRAPLLPRWANFNMHEIHVLTDALARLDYTDMNAEEKAQKKLLAELRRLTGQ